MSAPKRIQRKRTKGWRMPEGAVYVGRPSKWGNLWVVGEKDPWHHGLMSAADAVAAYRYGMDTSYGWVVAQELRGRDLACWCPLDRPCHADVLLEIANWMPARAACPSRVAAGRIDRCGLYSFPPACSASRCALMPKDRTP